MKLDLFLTNLPLTLNTVLVTLTLLCLPFSGWTQNCGLPSTPIHFTLEGNAILNESTKPGQELEILRIINTKSQIYNVPCASSLPEEEFLQITTAKNETTFNLHKNANLMNLIDKYKLKECQVEVNFECTDNKFKQTTFILKLNDLNTQKPHFEFNEYKLVGLKLPWRKNVPLNFNTTIIVIDNDRDLVNAKVKFTMTIDKDNEDDEEIENLDQLFRIETALIPLAAEESESEISSSSLATNHRFQVYIYPNKDILKINNLTSKKKSAGGRKERFGHKKVRSISNGSHSVHLNLAVSNIVRAVRPEGGSKSLSLTQDQNPFSTAKIYLEFLPSQLDFNVPTFESQLYKVHIVDLDLDVIKHANIKAIDPDDEEEEEGSITYEVFCADNLRTGPEEILRISRFTGELEFTRKITVQDIYNWFPFKVAVFQIKASNTRNPGRYSNATLLVYFEFTEVTPTTTIPSYPTEPTTPTPDFSCEGLPDGPYPNPEDCHTYYHCSNGYAYLQPCPTSLVFNPEIRACDYEWNVPGCGGTSTTNTNTEGPITSIVTMPGSTENPVPTSEMPNTTPFEEFPTTSNGGGDFSTTTRTMPTDSTFTPSTVSTDSTTAQTSQSPEFPTDFPTDPPTITTSTANPTTDIPNTSTDLTTETESEYLTLPYTDPTFEPTSSTDGYTGPTPMPCPEALNGSQFNFPDPQYCNRFYSCREGGHSSEVIRVSMCCSTDVPLIYCWEQDRCLDPENFDSNCTRCFGTTDESCFDEDTTQETPTTEKGQFECPESDKEGYYADPDYCNVYHVCWPGALESKHDTESAPIDFRMCCPEFNPYLIFCEPLTRCIYPEDGTEFGCPCAEPYSFDYTCGNGNGNGNETTGIISTTITFPPDPVPPTAPPSEPFKCPADEMDENGKNFADPFYCNRYYSCVFNGESFIAESRCCPPAEPYLTYCEKHDRCMDNDEIIAYDCECQSRYFDPSCLIIKPNATMYNYG